MARITKKMPSISNVVAGSTATLNLPVGRSYERLTFAYQGVTLSQMKNIKVIVDGKTVQEYPTAETLNKVNEFYGHVDGSGYLTLHFSRPEMATLEQQRFTGLGTAGVGTLQVMFDIDDAAANPVITCTALQSEAKGLGSIIKVKRFPLSSAVAGEIEIDKIVKGPAIRAIHLIDVDATKNTKPSALEVEIDSNKVYEASVTLAAEIQKQYGRVPQDNIYHCDFTLEGDYVQALVTAGAQDLRIRPTLPEAGALEVLVEYVDGWKGI